MNGTHSERAETVASEIRVLYVTADTATAETLASESDLTVHTAATADQAHTRLATDAIDCVVADTDLPETTGLAFFERVRERGFGHPVVLVATESRDGGAEAAFEAGVTDYVQPVAGAQVGQLAARVKRAVEEHRDDRFQAVFEAASDAIVVVNDDREYVEVNEAACELFGVASAELIGEPLSAFVPEGFDFEAAWREFRRSDSDHGEVPLVRPDGTRRVVEFAASESISPGRHLAILRDVTERRDRQQYLTVLDRVLRHNIRNDLTVIDNYAELITRDGSDEIAAYGERIREQSDQLLTTSDKERLVADLITNPPQINPVDVPEHCRRAVETAHRTHPTASVTLDQPAHLEALATDRLHEALFELVDNAVVHSDQAEPTVELTVSRTDGRVQIAVADDNPPIPEMNVGVITGEREIGPVYHGTGLGLWLVNRLITRSGGTLSFTERDAGGNVVTISLPLATE